MTRFRFDTKEQICWKALNNEMGLSDAAEALIHLDPSLQDPFSFIYPEAAILEEMLAELRENPQNREVIENKYREPVISTFNILLDIFTMPDVPYEQTKQFPIPRSLPQERD